MAKLVLDISHPSSDAEIALAAKLGGRILDQLYSGQLVPVDDLRGVIVSLGGDFVTRLDDYADAVRRCTGAREATVHDRSMVGTSPLRLHLAEVDRPDYSKPSACEQHSGPMSPDGDYR